MIYLDGMAVPWFLNRSTRNNKLKRGNAFSFLEGETKRLTKLTENPGQLPCHAVWSYQKFEILIGEKGSLQALFEVKLPKLFKFIIFYNLPAEKLQSRLSIL